MKKENIIVRIIGLIIFALSIYWFWKTNFDLITVWGIPLPLQIISAIIGFFTLITPAPFLRILAVFLPKELGERFTKFINDHLDHKDIDQVTIKPEDEGEVLADKLNNAIFLSKRRFYVGALVALIIFPLVTLYIINVKENEKILKIKDESSSLIKVVQQKRLSFGNFDTFHSILEETKDLTTLSSETSSVRRIYDLLNQIYDPNKVNSEATFRNELSNAYTKEFTNVFDNKRFDINKIKAPLYKTDPPESKQTLYILLAIICSYEGDNGRLVIPHIYGRGILNELFSLNKELPPTTYNLDGINYSSLLKSKQYKDPKDNFNNLDELLKSVSNGDIPSASSLAVKANSQFEEYNKRDTTNLGMARFRNNLVDMYIASIYLARIKEGINFNYTTQNEQKFVEEIKTKDLSHLFEKLNNLLEEARKLDPSLYTIEETTKAQLYSLEGQVNVKEETSNAKDSEWLIKKRNDAVKAISNAISNNQPKETFSEERTKNTSLHWLWEDGPTAANLESILK